MKDTYRKQVQLMLDVLPEVAKETSLAMHGGTAINLFCLDMPRLSVDIDLTYIPIADRVESLVGINQTLQSIQQNIQALRSSIHVEHRADVCKLLVNDNNVLIKLEVNTVSRGLIAKAEKMPLCELAQETFDAFCSMPVVPMSQLYGGKLCAALDRQLPRDLFDVKIMLKKEGFTDEIKRGLIYGLVSSTRPTYEMLNPNFQDQYKAYKNQFLGMSDVAFSYEDFEQTRVLLIRTIRENLTDADKAFLLSFNRLEPDWSLHNFREFPSVKWKLLNLGTFRRENPIEWQAQIDRLEEAFEL